jgi:hypothetical protein
MDDPTKEFTIQDRADLKDVIMNLTDRLFDEFGDSYTLNNMYKPFQVLIGHILPIADETFGNALPAAEKDYDEDDRYEVSLKKAAQRLMGSGRFDAYDDAEGVHAERTTEEERASRDDYFEAELDAAVEGVPFKECPDCKGSMRAVGHTDHYDD